MNKNWITFLAMVCFLFSGCGGGGGGAPAPAPTATVTGSASKSLALANGTDSVTITESVKDSAGNPVADGTPITFAVSGAGVLSSASSTTTGGTATVQVTHPAVPAPGTNETVNVTATAVSVTSPPVAVKFINPPSSATVQVALNSAVTFQTLVFDLTPGAGATFSTITPINEAASDTLATQVVPPNTYSLLKIHTPGITTVANSPILQFVFSIGSITSLPDFQVSNITATTDGTTPLQPPLTSTNFVVKPVFNTE